MPPYSGAANARRGSNIAGRARAEPDQNIEALERFASWQDIGYSGKGVSGARPGLRFAVHGAGELLRARAFSDNTAERLHYDWHGWLVTRPHHFYREDTRREASNKGEVRKAHGKMADRVAGLDEMLLGADHPLELARWLAVHPNRQERPDLR